LSKVRARNLRAFSHDFRKPDSDFPETIMRKGMIRKSGYRFSEEIMLKHTSSSNPAAGRGKVPVLPKGWMPSEI